ncbi:MAG: ester cyclase, partial [Acidimicrobiales bacterium]
AIEGDLAVTEHALSGTHLGSLFGVPATGLPVEVDTVVVWEFRNGKIRGETVYFDVATMLRQVGFLSLPAQAP